MIIAGGPAIITGYFTHSFWKSVVVFAIGLIVGFLVFNYFLRRFIYRKIKLIYKNIHRLNTEHISSPSYRQDPIASVSAEVSNWAQERRDEIALLKKQETFRREFIGNVSHELKTPIFQVQGYIHTLLDGALDDPKVNYMFLEKAAKSADRLVELVNDLTSISQLESGDIQLNYQKFNIRNLIVEVFEELDLSANKKKTKLGFKETSEKNLKVYADKSRIKQVITNLVMNGIKYGRENGQILCAVYDMDKNILVEIADDGEGIPKESIPRLFERFYRVEKSRTRDAGGSGLGLSIVKHIVEAHGQSINVRSKEGKGTTFTFTLQKTK
ncbi:MAG: sensor histidine kinase [Bacteroidetes bacterium]|nr:sensor histidine kinase [Bacteroidota bacterium]